MDDFVFDADTAARAADRGLCDHCLGRLFGKSGKGLTNDERGRIIRGRLGTGAPEGCTLCDGLFDMTERFAESVAESVNSVESDNFLVGCKVDPATIEAEKALWKELGIEGESIKAELNREIGKIALPMINRPVEFKNPQVVACIDTRFADVELDLSPLFIYGRYNKLSREIPQTIWPCRACKGRGCSRCDNTGKMYQTSVQEIIGDIALRMADGDEHFFHGMGREDIDALMLGEGRPFVLEISQPKKRDIDLDELELRANESDLAHYRSLSFTDREAVKKTKLATPTKTYKVRVRPNGKVNKEQVIGVALSFRDVCIDQRTPHRVEHRRADLIRKRNILWIEAEMADDGTFDLTLETESGTYVKEFVSGDEGRSIPSFSGALGVECTVETLDVIAINDQEELK